ncbi:MAG TPA: SDR family NAD(P)-dependent oxidoreductase [Clostridia bacterium]|nr:MAG: Serine 3-dehydrogenase [Firmicutes bacterium ADurb.Bin146]HOD93071.1 SDR family NAD(P)-dependent oxidoreductase [Clostridia bacterium]HQM39394.1 SDR family NAD(P)-dependent oxidoreductase [Clostridia bacterium]
MNVVITGAAGGLGRAFAVECAKRGYNLILTDICEQGLKTLAEGLIRSYDADVIYFTCDITDEKQTEKFRKFIDIRNIYIDMLFNVAGIDHEGAFTQRSFEQINSIVKVNIEATLRITYMMLNFKRVDEPFRIINVSSLASQFPMPLKAVYAASKRFILDFSYALNEELNEKNVYVLSLCPGGLATTQNAIEGMAVQGFFGNATSNRLEVVARKTIDKSLRKRRVYIPGALNRIFSVAGKFLPVTMITRVIYMRWKRALSLRCNT